jgi:hypothetical protein
LLSSWRAAKWEPPLKVRLRLDDERSVAINPQRHPHLDHGYAVMSYSSQGQTAERVLVHVDTQLGAKDRLNSRMAYVSITLWHRNVCRQGESVDGLSFPSPTFGSMLVAAILNES